MAILRVSCNDQVLAFMSTPIIASGAIEKSEIEVDFCEEWNGYEKTIIFYKGQKVYRVGLDVQNRCFIPREITDEIGKFSFGVCGVNGTKRLTSTILTYNVSKGAYEEGQEPATEPSGTFNIDQNGIYEISAYKTVNVNTLMRVAKINHYVFTDEAFPLTLYKCDYDHQLDEASLLSKKVFYTMQDFINEIDTLNELELQYHVEQDSYTNHGDDALATDFFFVASGGNQYSDYWFNDKNTISSLNEYGTYIELHQDIYGSETYAFSYGDIASGGLFKVNSLPTEYIDSESIYYLVNEDKYYRYVNNEWVEMVLNQ